MHVGHGDVQVGCSSSTAAYAPVGCGDPTPPTVAEAVRGLPVPSTGAEAVRTLGVEHGCADDHHQVGLAPTDVAAAQHDALAGELLRCTDTAARVEPIRLASGTGPPRTGSLYGVPVLGGAVRMPVTPA